MQTGFWGLCALAAILWGHGVYKWKETAKQSEAAEIKKAHKVLLAVIAVLTAAALVAGIVLMQCDVEEAAAHVMGLATLCLAFGANSVLRRMGQ